MSRSDHPRVGYVMKMYPRFSETFIVNEILAHEETGADLQLYSLRPPADGRFHAALADVRAPVTYLTATRPKSMALWADLAAARARFPRFDRALPLLLEAEVRDAAQAIALAGAIDDAGVDHLHAHFASVATTVTRLASALTGIPYSFTAHAKDIFHESVEAADLSAKLRDASAVVTVSEFNLAHLRREHGDAAAGVRRVYNGLDLRRFPHTDPAGRPRRIVAVGRLVEKKGFDDLLLACRVLLERGVDLRCELIGTGPEESRLRALVAEHDLAGHVDLRGALPQDGVIAAVAGAAVMAAPCVVARDGNRDGLPTVLLEAMALGTPCVTTDVTGIPEVLRDGVTGLAVPQRDPAALADALQRLLDDTTLRSRLAGAARALVERDFDVRGQTAALRTIFAASASASTTRPAGAREPLGAGAGR